MNDNGGCFINTFLILGLLALILTVTYRAAFYSKPEEVSDGNITGGEINNNREIAIAMNRVRFVMKYVEGGTFQMGSADNDAFSDEYPQHSVTLNSFYMGETEVTQELWNAVMGTTIVQQRNKADSSGPLRGVGSNYPMYYVNWYECQEFVQTLNHLSGRHFRLPTEAEWEYAAKGGNRGKGYKFAGSGSLGESAWYSFNSDSTTHPVKSKIPNELGLYDMSGNVWEWCSDRYGSNYYSNSPLDNPQGDNGGRNNVVRGGSWYSKPSYCRLTKRHSLYPYHRNTCYGIRLVMD